MEYFDPRRFDERFNERRRRRVIYEPVRIVYPRRRYEDFMHRQDDYELRQRNYRHFDFDRGRGGEMRDRY